MALGRFARINECDNNVSCFFLAISQLHLFEDGTFFKSLEIPDDAMSVRSEEGAQEKTLVNMTVDNM